MGSERLLGNFPQPGSDPGVAAGGTEGTAAAAADPAALSNHSPHLAPGGDPLGHPPLTAGLRSGQEWNQGDAISNILLDAGQAALASTPSLKAPGLFAVGGALTDPQFQVVIRALSQTKSGDILTRPSVVTRSGQRATVDVIREFPYPTEYDPPEIPQEIGGFGNDDGGFFGNGGGALLGGNNNNNNFAPANSFPVTPAHPTAFEVRNLGTHLEVEPVVGPDGYTIELNLAPEVVRFEGFINYGSPITTASTDIFGNPTTVPVTDNRILQPVFKTLKETTSVVVWDGAVVVFGGVIEERVQQVADKVPIVGDMPFFGRLFRSKGEDTLKRAVMFFVQANVIDPSGQRINAQ